MIRGARMETQQDKAAKQARKEFNRTRAMMAAQIAAGIAVYDANTSHDGETCMSKRQIAKVSVDIADEIVAYIQERERG